MAFAALRWVTPLSVSAQEAAPARKLQNAQAMDITTRTIAPQPTIAARTTTTRDRLGELFGRYLPEVAHEIADHGRRPAGPAYGRYHATGDDEYDVEIGIPIDAPAANLRSLDEAQRGELAASELPGGEIAVALHEGAYDTLPQAFEAVERWIGEQGRDIAGPPWESYVVDMSEVDDPSQLRTEVCWPLA